VAYDIVNWLEFKQIQHRVGKITGEVKMPVTYFRHNLITLRRQPLAEISGSLGDLGTFLPILISLSTHNQISLSTTLIFTGIYNILTGLFFGIPLPVQPMKAIAAVALVRDLSAGSVAAAGIFVSACVGLAAATQLLWWINEHVPIPVVKGIQVGAGLSLCMAGGKSILGLEGWTGPSWADNWIWAIFAFLFLLVVSSAASRDGRRWAKVPYALIVFAVGLIFAGILVGTNKHANTPGFRAWNPYINIPKGKNWSHGIIEAGIGQLPLTTLNSVIAVVQLASDILPDIETPTVTSIGLSVAAMNLVGCWFGAMPTCHGSGGLAAQYRFGARSGASIMLLGLFKLVLGLVFGESLADLLKYFPKSMLAVMVIAAGLELASVGESLNTPRARDVKKREQSRGAHGAAEISASSSSSLDDAERKRRWTVMLITIAGIVAFRNDAIGFIAGMLTHWSYNLPDWFDMVSERTRSSTNGRIRLGSTSHSRDEEAPLVEDTA
jgi:hypothetical protein